MKLKKEFCINIEHESCQSCKNGWIGPKFDGIPEPMPDYSKLPAYHYKDVFSCSCLKDDGSLREVDDFLPRPNITKKFNNGELVPGDKQKVEEFSDVFIVEERYVEEYLTHLMNLKRTTKIREKQRQKESHERKEKHFNDYDWEFLTSSTNEMRKLLVFELDKYIEHFKLSKHGKKIDKIKRVMAHHLEKASIIKKAKNMQLTDQVSKKTVISSDSENDTSEDENSDMED